jgi:hypothetical protein
MNQTCCLCNIPNANKKIVFFTNYAFFMCDSCDSTFEHTMSHVKHFVKMYSVQYPECMHTFFSRKIAQRFVFKKMKVTSMNYCVNSYFKNVCEQNDFIFLEKFNKFLDDDLEYSTVKLKYFNNMPMTQKENELLSSKFIIETIVENNNSFVQHKNSIFIHF